MDSDTLAARYVRVLYEDEHYLFVDKPAGLRLTGGGSRQASSALDWLADTLDQEGLRVVHPLEDLVSGVLPLAKSEEASDRLMKALASPRTRIDYLSVASGQPRLPGQTGKGGRRQKSTTLPVRLVRQRKKLSLVACHHPAARTAAVRADLQTVGLVTLGDVPRKRRSSRPGKRLAGRLFLHRASVRCRHPYTRQPLAVKAGPPAAFKTAMTAADLLEDTLEVALMARLTCLGERGTDAYRLFAGKPDGIAGLVVEQLGRVAILQTHQGKFQGDQDRIRRVAKWYKRALTLDAVYHKRFVANRSSSPDDDPELRSPVPLLGKAVPEEFEVTENKLRLLVRPYDGASVGLFLDQRENRRRVRELAAGRRVLNAFSYTCGFSVAAAKGQASETVNVDVSKRALEWGKRNFGANKLALDKHMFIRSDIFDYFKRARRQKRSFDLMILDAPTFARSKKPARVFSIAKDLPRLLEEALGLLAPDGCILLSTNNRALSAAALREHVAEAAAAAGRRFQITTAPLLPPDFASDTGYAKSLIVRFA